MPPQLLEGMCGKYGNSAMEFYQDCVANAPGGIGDPASFCAWLHNECLGQHPGANAASPPMERRHMKPAETRIAVADGRKLTGYAAVFDSPTDVGGFLEVIRPGAFTNALTEDDVILLFNHDANLVLGRLSSKTLTLAEDQIGLRYEATLPDTSYANDLLEVVKRGDVRGGSFAFWVEKEAWVQEGDGANMQSTREILEVKLQDVSVVTFPAYPATDFVSARAMRTAYTILQNHLAASTGRAVPGAQPPARLSLARKRLEVMGKE
jgi:HK97 family phage prohead protease